MCMGGGGGSWGSAGTPNGKRPESKAGCVKLQAAQISALEVTRFPGEKRGLFTSEPVSHVSRRALCELCEGQPVHDRDAEHFTARL